MKKFGLPTYPVTNGMVLGERDAEEIDWLLNYGVLTSHLRGYYKVARGGDGVYQLIRMSSDTTSGEVVDVGVIEEAPSLQTLVKKHTLHISAWHWQANDA